MGSAEAGRCVRTAADAQQHGPVRADDVEHGTHVIEPLLHLDDGWTVGEPRAALVEEDHTAERGEPANQPRDGLVPPEIQVTHEIWDDEDVYGAVANHLIR